MTKGLARKLSRTKAHRTALLKNLVSELFAHGSIMSTHEKCMEARNLAERVVTMCNKDITLMGNVDGGADTIYRRNIQSRLFLAGDNAKLLKKVYGIYKDNGSMEESKRKSGFTRVLRLEPRLNDGAKQSILELVDYPVLEESGNDGEFSLHRGNIKLWLLIKTVLHDEANNLPHSELTLKNFNKMALFKNKEVFKREIKAIRSILLQELYSDKTIAEDEETKIVDKLLTDIYDYTPAPPTERTGFMVMEERPQSA